MEMTETAASAVEEKPNLLECEVKPETPTNPTVEDTEDVYKVKHDILLKEYTKTLLSNERLLNKLCHVKKVIFGLKRLKSFLVRRLIGYGDRFMDVSLEIPDSDPSKSLDEDIFESVCEEAERLIRLRNSGGSSTSQEQQPSTSAPSQTNSPTVNRKSRTGTPSEDPTMACFRPRPSSSATSQPQTPLPPESPVPPVFFTNTLNGPNQLLQPAASTVEQQQQQQQPPPIQRQQQQTSSFESSAVTMPRHYMPETTIASVQHEAQPQALQQQHTLLQQQQQTPLQQQQQHILQQQQQQQSLTVGDACLIMPCPSTIPPLPASASISSGQTNSVPVKHAPVRRKRGGNQSQDGSDPAPPKKRRSKKTTAAANAAKSVAKESGVAAHTTSSGASASDLQLPSIEQIVDFVASGGDPGSSSSDQL